MFKILLVLALTVVVCHSDKISRSSNSTSKSKMKPARSGEQQGNPENGSSDTVAVDVPEGMESGRVVDLTVAPSGNFFIDFKSDDENIALHFVARKEDNLTLCNQKKDNYWQTEYQTPFIVKDWSTFSIRIVKYPGEFHILNNGTRFMICKHTNDIDVSKVTKVEVSNAEVKSAAVDGKYQIGAPPSDGGGSDNGAVGPDDGSDVAGGQDGGRNVVDGSGSPPGPADKKQNTPYVHEVQINRTDNVTVNGIANGDFSISLQTTDSTDINPDIGLMLLFRLAKNEGVMVGNSYIKHRWGDEIYVVLIRREQLLTGFKMVIVFGSDSFQVNLPDEKTLEIQYRMPLGDLNHVVVRGSAWIDDVRYTLRDG